MNLNKLPQAKRGYIIVTKIENSIEDNKTASGIYMPEKNSENSLFLRAKVESVGASMDDYPSEVKKGDIILANKKNLEQSDKTFNVNGVAHYVLNEATSSYAIL